MSLEKWLEPVSEDDPCGPDIEYEVGFMELEQAATEKRTEEFRSESGELIGGEAKGVNWNEVRTTAEALLRRSKDLRVAVYLTRALLRTVGFRGIADGLALINGLLENFWEGVHPRLDEDDQDPTMRVNALAPLGSLEVVVADLRASVVISSRRHGQLSVRDIEVAQGRLKPTGESSTLSEAQLGALLAAAVEEVPDLPRVARQALTDLKALGTLVSDRAGASYAPDLKHLQTVLYNVSVALDAAAPSASEAEATASESEEAEEGGALRASVPRTAGGAGEIRSREDVVRVLGRLCEYLVKNEPTNPVQILLRRAQRMMNMSFLELMNDLAPDGLEQAETVVGEKLVRDEE